MEGAGRASRGCEENPNERACKLQAAQAEDAGMKLRQEASIYPVVLILAGAIAFICIGFATTTRPTKRQNVHLI